MKKRLAIILSSLLCISSVGCSSKLNSTDVVATVNGNDITVKQFQSTLALYKQSLESMYGSTIWDTEVEEGVKYKDKFKDIMLDQMIDIEAVCEQARKEKLVPTKEEVDKAFDDLKKNIDADKEYKNELKEMGIDDTYLRNQQEQDLIIQKYKENFDKNVKITDEEMKKYYDEHKKDYYKDEVKASHILISTVDDNGKPLSEAKKKEAKKKAEEVLKKAKAGEDFAKLAEEYSDDPGSASKGGDLGYFGKGEMVKPFEEAAFSLKPGQISGIVESDYGYHIIKVFDKIDEQQPLSEVKDSIKTTLLNEKYAQTVENLKKSAKIEKNEEAIKKIKF